MEYTRRTICFEEKINNTRAAIDQMSHRITEQGEEMKRLSPATGSHESIPSEGMHEIGAEFARLRSDISMVKDQVLSDICSLEGHMFEQEEFSNFEHKLKTEMGSFQVRLQTVEERVEEVTEEMTQLVTNLAPDGVGSAEDEL